MSISDLFVPNPYPLFAASFTANGDATFTYNGTMSGPWSVPQPATFTLMKKDGLVSIVVHTPQQAVVDVLGADSITFLPAIPAEFRPPVDSASVLLISAAFGLPVNYGTALLSVTTTGFITAYSFAGAFALASQVGLAPSSTLLWSA